MFRTVASPTCGKLIHPARVERYHQVGEAVFARRFGCKPFGRSEWMEQANAGIVKLRRAGASREMARRAYATSANAAGTTAVTNLIRQSDKYFETDTRPIILYDGVCNLCNGGVNFMLSNDPEGKARFAALQSEAGRALLARSGKDVSDISSIVLVEKDKVSFKSDAILRIGQLLHLPYQILATLAFLAPMPVRDGVYDLVANNRYSILGKQDTCRLSDDNFTERFVQ